MVNCILKANTVHKTAPQLEALQHKYIHQWHVPFKICLMLVTCFMMFAGLKVTTNLCFLNYLFLLKLSEIIRMGFT
jgi:hypothetical protein